MDVNVEAALCLGMQPRCRLIGSFRKFTSRDVGTVIGRRSNCIEARTFCSDVMVVRVSASAKLGGPSEVRIFSRMRSEPACCR